MNGTKLLRDFSQQKFRANTKNALKGEKNILKKLRKNSLMTKYIEQKERLLIITEKDEKKIFCVLVTGN